MTQDEIDKFFHTVDEQIKLVKEKLAKEKLLVCTRLYCIMVRELLLSSGYHCR